MLFTLNISKQIFMKTKILFIAMNFLLWINCNSQTSLNITYANDSVYYLYFGCPVGTPPITTAFNIKVNMSGYNNDDTLVFKEYFGDGAHLTWSRRVEDVLFYGGVGFGHDYLALGTYDVTYIVSDKYGNSDTVFHPAEVILSNNCSNLISYLYVDNNSNCVYDPGELLINNVPYTLYNGLSTYQITTVNSNIPIQSAVNYTAFINANSIQQLGYNLTCPVSGFLNFTSSGSDTLYFAVDCNSYYDLSIVSSGYPYVLDNSTLVNVAVSDISCAPQSGTYTLTLDPRLSFVYALHLPSSGSGQNYSWNYSNLTSNGTISGSLSNMMYFDLDPSVQIGDVLCYSYSVTPLIGDMDVTNNTVNICHTVLGAWDPNYKEVYPKGEGINGDINQNIPLTYTIGFQNTGSASAKDVYILDTLDSDLNISSLQIVASSHSMQLYIINGNILKFDFQNIQLPDSGANQMLSHGYVVYKINQNTDLPIGTQIKNKAGIYFNSNPAVITNETLNTIHQLSSVNELKRADEFFSIMPNPSSDKIKIIVKPETVLKNSLVSIFNIQGLLLYQQIINNVESEFDISNLVNGIYVVKLSNSENVKVAMLVKR